MNQPVKTRVFVATWAPANIGLANSATTAMIYHNPQRNEYFADIRHVGEFIETVTAPTIDAVRDELEARATLL
jgi:hypothetical protein